MLDIYDAGIATGNATFEASAPNWNDWDATDLQDHRLVAVDIDIESLIVGWAALAPVSDRCAYAGVVENSVYIHPERHGQGIGRPLLATLIASTEAAGIWTIQTGIFPENTASIALHEQAGFRIVGTRERLGQLNGTWRDTRLLESRSRIVG